MFIAAENNDCGLNALARAKIKKIQETLDSNLTLLLYLRDGYKTQTAVTNICLNCIPFMNLTFHMLQHTSSEVIIIQLQINLNSKIQPYGLGTNEIDLHT